MWSRSVLSKHWRTLFWFITSILNVAALMTKLMSTAEHGQDPQKRKAMLFCYWQLLSLCCPLKSLMLLFCYTGYDVTWAAAAANDNAVRWHSMEVVAAHHSGTGRQLSCAWWTAQSQCWHVCCASPVSRLISLSVSLHLTLSDLSASCCPLIRT